jgi:subtilisin family serine protease
VHNGICRTSPKRDRERRATISVVDSGIDGGHPDLSGQIKLNRNFVQGRTLSAESAGTGVALEQRNNLQGIVGVATHSGLLWFESLLAKQVDKRSCVIA